MGRSLLCLLGGAPPPCMCLYVWRLMRSDDIDATYGKTNIMPLPVKGMT